MTEVTGSARRVIADTVVVSATPRARMRASQRSARRATGEAVKLRVGTERDKGVFRLRGALRSAVGAVLKKAKEPTDGT